MDILEKLNREKIFFSAVIIFIAYLLFYQLGSAPFENWDEAWYADATKHMLNSKNVIVLQWNYSPWFDKPPFFIWLTSFFSSILGLSELSVRLPSAISGFLIVIGVVIYTYRKYSIIGAGIALSTLALNNIFIWRARSGNIDSFVSLLIFLTFFLLISNHRYKYHFLGIVFACIYLTKASLVLFPLFIFIIFELVYKRKEILKNYYRYLYVLVWFLGISGGWLSLGYLEQGKDFLNYYLFYSDQGVASLNQFNTNYLYHTYYSLQRRFFWLLLIGAFFALFKLKSKEYFLLLLYAFLLLIQLSFTEKNNNWYLIPAMPFWSILCAFGAYSLLRILKNNKVIVIIFISISLYISYRTYTINILPILHTSSTAAQTQSAKNLKMVVPKNEIIVRLDHLYPTTVFYSDRKVLASPPEASTKLYWISRLDLVNEIKKREIRWLSGSNKDVETFIKNNPELNVEVKKVNNEEAIVQVL